MVSITLSVAASRIPALVEFNKRLVLAMAVNGEVGSVKFVVYTAVPLTTLKSEKYTGRRYYNSGELISVLYPIVGKEDQYIQVDNIISLTEEEHAFKGSFLDLPAEKQGLIIGLAKVILLEQDPQDVFRRMGISNIPEHYAMQTVLCKHH